MIRKILPAGEFDSPVLLPTCDGSTATTANVPAGSTTTTKATTTTTTTTAAATTTSTGSSGTVAKYGQCGGIGWTGATTCVSGSTCTKLNDYYYQCV